MCAVQSFQSWSSWQTFDRQGKQGDSSEVGDLWRRVYELEKEKKKKKDVIKEAHEGMFESTRSCLWPGG